VIGELMKKTIVLFLSLILVSSLYAQTENSKRYLRSKKHYKEVVKETKKVEKALSEPVPAEPVEEEQAAVIEPVETPPPVEEAVATPAEPVEPDYSGFMSLAEAFGDLQIIKVAADQFGRQVKLVSDLGYGGYVSLGYRFNKYIAIVGDYSIRNVKFSDFDIYSISQDHAALMAGRIGPRIYIIPQISLEVLAGLEQHYAAYSSSLTKVVAERFTHGSIDLGVNYSMLELKRFLMSGRTDFKAFIPMTKSAWQTATGLGIASDLKFGVVLNEECSLYTKFAGEFLNLKPTLGNQYEVDVYMGMGLNYKF